MPGPKAWTHEALPHSEMLQRALNQAGNADLFGEISQLRREIRELREAMSPPKSIIITGGEVDRIIAALSKDAKL